ncbi:MAG: hypothetical protein NT069_14275 [Planctomycetota bacterium]|nr:hypothetical protein [Planctomycetota bacterium]
MASQVLTLLLAMTQFLSWNAAPLYLCVSESGLVRLDGGPAGCGGCGPTSVGEGAKPTCDHDHEGGCQHAHSGHPHSKGRRSSDRDHWSETLGRESGTPCECAHWPLLAQQDDLVRPAGLTVVTPTAMNAAWIARTEHIPGLGTGSRGIGLRGRSGDPPIHWTTWQTIVLRC